MNKFKSSPGINYPPPLAFVVTFGIGLLVNRRIPLSITELFESTIGNFVAVVLASIGLGIMGWGLMAFRRYKTAIYPNVGASSLVTTGPYRYSRNPMYVGLATMYFGGALLVNSAWPIIMLPFVILWVNRFIIDREERHLKATFPDEYKEYSSRVRRWV